MEEGETGGLMERSEVLLGWVRDEVKRRGDVFTCVVETERPRLPNRGKVNLFAPLLSIS